MMKPISQNDCLEQLKNGVDYLFLCASFEKRCLSIIDYISPDKIKETGILLFEQYKNDIKDHVDELCDSFKGANIYECSNSTPITIADSLVRAFSNLLKSDSIKNKKNIVIDISTFTRESLLITIKFLQLNREKLNKIYAFYSAADAHEILSNGIVEIRSVLGYMGDIVPNKPLHVIVLAGFELERAKGIIDSLEPDSIALGYGGKEISISDQMQKKNKALTDELKACYIDDSINLFEYSLIDINSTKQLINAEILKKPDHNIVLLPLNNKISTIAAGLAAIEYPHVQICYAQMRNYNISDYSAPRNECYLFELLE